MEEFPCKLLDFRCVIEMSSTEFEMASFWRWALTGPGAELDVLSSLLSWDRLRFLVVDNYVRKEIRIYTRS